MDALGGCWYCEQKNWYLVIYPQISYMGEVEHFKVESLKYTEYESSGKTSRYTSSRSGKIQIHSTRGPVLALTYLDTTGNANRPEAEVYALAVKGETLLIDSCQRDEQFEFKRLSLIEIKR